MERRATYRFRGEDFACWCLMAVFGTIGCSSSPKAAPLSRQDAEMLNVAAAGQLAFSRGSYEIAAEQFRRALDRARLQDDPGLIGDQAYNLAITLLALGKTSEAGDRLYEAEAALRRSGAALADVLLVEARLLYLPAESPQPDLLASVEAAAGRVLDDPASKPQPMHRAQVEVLRAEIACDRRDAEAALGHLSRAKDFAPSTPSAALARATARLQMLQGNAVAAAASFDDEVRLQRQGGRYPDMARALLKAGDAYARAGQTDIAADRYYRAAVSFAAQDRRPQAITALDAAEQAALKPRAPLQLRNIQSLRRELTPATSGNLTPASSPSP